MFTFQFPILWYGDKCGVDEGMRSTEWFACMYVTNFSQKLLDRIAWNFQGWFVIIQGPIN